MEESMIKIICGDNEYDVEKNLLIKSEFFKSKIERWTDKDSNLNTITIDTDFRDVILDYIKHLRNPYHIPKKDLWQEFRECVSYFGKNKDKSVMNTYQQIIFLDNIHNTIKYHIPGKNIEVKKIILQHNIRSIGIITIKFYIDDKCIHQYNLDTHSADVCNQQPIQIGNMVIGHQNNCNIIEFDDDIINIINLNTINESRLECLIAYRIIEQSKHASANKTDYDPFKIGNGNILSGKIFTNSIITDNSTIYSGSMKESSYVKLEIKYDYAV